ncbi:MAG: polysulfide reductase NrfD [Eubacteriales bacterium]|nr:polysulfide reductase NrfD [Eubacteriales bacterium]
MKRRYLGLLIGLVLCGAGLAGWIYQIINGLAITDMNNLFSWGLYMGTFEFFIGVSSGGMLLFSLAYLFRVDSLKPYAKLGAFTAFGSVVAAGVAIMTDLGQPFRVMQMLITPNVASPLFWDVIVLGVYAIICLVAVILVIKDGKNEQAFAAKARKLSWVAFPFVFIMNAVTTLMFAVQNSREWWHSAILPADSMTVGVNLGLSFMLLVCAITVPANSFERDRAGFQLMARIAAGALLVHFAFTALELSTLAWNGSEESKHLLDLVFGTYGTLSLFEMLLPFLAMLALMAKGRGKTWYGVSGLLVVVGMFIHRMMLLLPAFNSIGLTIPVPGAEPELWSFPISSGFFEEGQDVFIRFWDYAPTPLELCVNLLPFGVVIAVVALSKILFTGNKGSQAAK